MGSINNNTYETEGLKMPWHAANNIVYWTLPCNSSDIWKHTEKDHKFCMKAKTVLGNLWKRVKGWGKLFAFYLNFWKKVKINRTTKQLSWVREIWQLLVLGQAWTQGFSKPGVNNYNKMFASVVIVFSLQNNGYTKIVNVLLNWPVSKYYHLK